MGMVVGPDTKPEWFPGDRCLSENEEEVLVKEELVEEELVEEELVEEDAKILIYLIQLYEYKYVIII